MNPNHSISDVLKMTIQQATNNLTPTGNHTIHSQSTGQSQQPQRISVQFEPRPSPQTNQLLNSPMVESGSISNHTTPVFLNMLEQQSCVQQQHVSEAALIKWMENNPSVSGRISQTCIPEQDQLPFGQSANFIGMGNFQNEIGFDINHLVIPSQSLIPEYSPQHNNSAVNDFVKLHHRLLRLEHGLYASDQEATKLQTDTIDNTSLNCSSVTTSSKSGSSSLPSSPCKDTSDCSSSSPIKITKKKRSMRPKLVFERELTPKEIEQLNKPEDLFKITTAEEIRVQIQKPQRGRKKEQQSIQQASSELQFMKNCYDQCSKVFKQDSNNEQ